MDTIYWHASCHWTPEFFLCGPLNLCKAYLLPSGVRGSYQGVQTSPLPSAVSVVL